MEIRESIVVKRRKAVHLAEGKTKIIRAVEGDPTAIDMVAKTDITAGDGAKHDIFEGKDVWATTTTCNVFELLKACGVPVAYRGQTDERTIRASKCTMLPYEVVARRVALGSYLKRNPNVPYGERLATLVVEFFLKTSGKKFGSIDLTKDDPLITSWSQEGLRICRPDMAGQVEAITIPASVIYGKESTHPLYEMEKIVRRVFMVLEHAWMMQDCELCDIKIEFGFDSRGKLLVADVIDNDSWRLFDESGQHLDKQRYRDGESLEEVAALYEEVAQRSGLFEKLALKPLIILWRASESDDLGPFQKAHAALGAPAEIVEITGSVHKAPERCLSDLRGTLLYGSFSTVVIAYVGRSNGAGPVFAADTHVPVIAVPSTVEEFPNDVWSSLRMPSHVPLMTVLEPSNAIEAALGILAQRSPSAYAARRLIAESHKLNKENSPTYGTSIYGRAM